MARGTVGAPHLCTGSMATPAVKTSGAQRPSWPGMTAQVRSRAVGSRAVRTRPVRATPGRSAADQAAMARLDLDRPRPTWRDRMTSLMGARPRPTEHSRTARPVQPCWGATAHRTGWRSWTLTLAVILAAVREPARRAAGQVAALAADQARVAVLAVDQVAARRVVAPAAGQAAALAAPVLRADPAEAGAVVLQDPAVDRRVAAPVAVLAARRRSFPLGRFRMTTRRRTAQAAVAMAVRAMAVRPAAVQATAVPAAAARAGPRLPAVFQMGVAAQTAAADLRAVPTAV